MLGVLTACSNNRVATLKNLNDRSLVIEKESVKNVTDAEVMNSYHAYLDEAPVSHSMYSNALNRLADLEMKAGDDKLLSDKDEIFQQALEVATINASEEGQSNYENAVELYNGLLAANPNSPRNDWVLYQLASAYEKLGQLEKALATLSRLVSAYPSSDYRMEAQFRQGDIYFLLQDYILAEKSFKSIVVLGKSSVYYDRSIYKYGWSLFKQERYELALDAFFMSFKTLPIVYDLQEKIDTRALSKVEKDMLEDIFRAINLCISYGGGVKYVSRYFSTNKQQPYEYEVFKRLGDYFIEHDRIKDAADTYGVFVVKQPFHPMSPTLQVSRIKAYDSGRFGRAALSAREEFVNRFGVETTFWKKQNTATKAILRKQAKSILDDLAEYYHARLQRDRKDKDNFSQAVHWYKEYINTFPGDEKAAEKQFLLGELYSEKRFFKKSAEAYYRAAYNYPAHKYSEESAYAAIDTYNNLLKKAKANNVGELRSLLVDASNRYVERFVNAKNLIPVKVRLVEELFRLKHYDKAERFAKEVLSDEKALKKTGRERLFSVSVTVVIGHIAFDREDYLKAQASYQNALSTGIRGKKLKALVTKRLAASTYKYAEQMNNKGNFVAAAEGFMSVSNVLPKSSMDAQAQYDAAVAYIKVQNWVKAIGVLEQFRRNFPDHKLQMGVVDKLALCYENNGQFSMAADEVLKIGERSKNNQVYKNSVLQAAALYEKGKSKNAVIKTYKFYVRNFRLPLEESLEIRQKLANLYFEQGQIKKQNYWLRHIADSKINPSKISDRSKYIISSAAIKIANQKMMSYQSVRLNLPFSRSLKKKHKLMKSALKAYEQVADIGVEEFTTAATFNIANMYQHLGSSIMTSERPKKLNAEEREEYDLLLEEQAYPFEEKAISIFEVNVRRINDGVYDEWVKKSVDKLALIQPVRYGKQELLDEQYASID